MIEKLLLAIKNNENFNLIEVKNLKLENRKFTKFEINNSSFISCLFSKAYFQDCKIEESDFSNSNFDHSDFYNIRFKNVKMKNCKMRNIMITNSELKNVDLSNSDLSGSNLSNVDLNKVNFTNANLSYCNLSGANLLNANLTGANLSYCNLHRAKMMNSNLTDANLKRANLSNTKFSDQFLTPLEKAFLVEPFETSEFSINKPKIAIFKNTRFENTLVNEVKFTENQLNGIIFADKKQHQKNENILIQKIEMKDFCILKKVKSVSRFVTKSTQEGELMLVFSLENGIPLSLFFSEDSNVFNGQVVDKPFIANFVIGQYNINSVEIMKIIPRESSNLSNKD